MVEEAPPPRRGRPKRGAAARTDLFGAPEGADPPTKAAAPSDLDLRQGHRARLRDRFLGGGLDGVADYELLELVLFRAIPRRDVKPLAKRLIQRFGGFAEALSAPKERLREIDGLGDAAIAELKIVEASAHLLTRERAKTRPSISGWSALMDYCRATLAHQPIERFRVLYLDKKNGLLADEDWPGTLDQAPVYPREIVKRALELGAGAMILAHNHPSGDPKPSQADIAVTRQLIDAAAPLGIIVHDHIVIGAEGVASLRDMGKI